MSEEKENFEKDEPTATSSSSSSNRPVGQKASKRMKLQQASNANVGAQMAEASNRLVEATKEKALLSRARTVAINRMVFHSIMSVDLTMLSETAKEYYRVEQERILQNIKEKATIQDEPQPSFEETSESDEPDEFSEIDVTDYDDVV